MQLTEKQQNKVRKIAKVIDEGNLAVAKMILELEEKIDEEIPSIKDVISRVKGEKGDTPTDELLVSLIEPLIPQVTDGHTPTRAELLDLIQPLIPKVENGKTPTKKELLDLIKPLLPKPINTDNIVLEASTRAVEQLKSSIPTIPQIIDNIPVIGEKVRDALELLPVQEKLSIEAIEDLRKELDEIKKKGGEHIVSTSNRGLYQLLDVNVSGVQIGQTIAWDGTQWIPATNDTDDQTLQQVTDNGSVTTNTITVNSLIETVPTLLKLDQTTPQTTVGTFTFPRVDVSGDILKFNTAGTQGVLGYGAGGTTYAGLWLKQATPSFANYNFLADATDTFFNAPTNLYFRIGNSTRMRTTTTGVSIGINPPAPTNILNVYQPADSSGIRIFGYDDKITSYIEMSMNGNGLPVFDTNASVFYFNKSLGITSGSSLQVSSWGTTGIRQSTIGHNNLQLFTTTGGTGGQYASGFITICQVDDYASANRNPSYNVPDPTLRIYSADSTQADDWIQFSHDQTDPVINWGNHNIGLRLRGNRVDIGGDDWGSSQITVSSQNSVNEFALTSETYDTYEGGVYWNGGDQRIATYNFSTDTFYYFGGAMYGSYANWINVDVATTFTTSDGTKPISAVNTNYGTTAYLGGEYYAVEGSITGGGSAGRFTDYNYNTVDLASGLYAIQATGVSYFYGNSNDVYLNYTDGFNGYGAYITSSDTGVHAIGYNVSGSLHYQNSYGVYGSVIAGGTAGYFDGSGLSETVSLVNGTSAIDAYGYSYFHDDYTSVSMNNGIALTASDGTNTVSLADGTYSINATGPVNFGNSNTPVMLTDSATVSSPFEGQIAYDYTNHYPVFYDGSNWVQI